MPDSVLHCPHSLTSIFTAVLWGRYYYYDHHHHHYSDGKKWSIKRLSLVCDHLARKLVQQLSAAILCCLWKQKPLYPNLCLIRFNQWQQKIFSEIQFSSFSQSCPTLCDPMNCSKPGLPVYHNLPEFTQTHIHRGGDAIQPSHPLSFLSPPVLNLSQLQGLFKWVSSSHQVAKVLEFQLQHQSFQWITRTDLL